MILPFSKQLNGKTTYFVERIWEGLLRNYFQDDKEYIEFMNAHKKRFGIDWDWFPDEHNRLTNPKIHTIREDKKERWQIGTKIDFFINVRQKNMFRFAPVLPVLSTQKVEIIHTKKLNGIIVNIDGRRLSPSELQDFALNDGFDTLNEFIAYFNKEFTGKLIHWTAKRY